MTVSVASRFIHRRSGLSEAGRLVLDWIDRGPEWLDWAIDDPHARYRFEDENALVAGIQSGLHASPFLLLPVAGLLVGPVKLMTLTLADLRILKRWEDGGKGVALKTSVDNICIRYGLLTQAQLDSDAQFLVDCGVSAKPLFQVMSFEDRVAIHELVHGNGDDEPPSPESKEATDFAMANATTPLEFVDYYRAYLQYQAAAATPSDTGVGDAMEALLPLLFGALDCPRVDGPVAPWEVGAAIEEWLTMGRRLGFPRLSRGIQQVIAHTDFPAQDLEAAPRIVAAYLAGAQTVVQTAALGSGEAGQDGASRIFRVSSGGTEAVITLGPDGLITLSALFDTAPTQATVLSPANGGKNGKG